MHVFAMIPLLFVGLAGTKASATPLWATVGTVLGGHAEKIAWYGPGYDKLSMIDDVAELSRAERAHIRQVTGFVSCPDLNGRTDSRASAALVGSNSYVLTVEHEFKDKSGKTTVNLSKCYFRNQDVPSIRIDLDVNRGRAPNLVLGEHYHEHWYDDYALAKLKDPLANAVPLPVDPNGGELWRGDKVVTVSAYQAGITITDWKNPYVQICHINGVVHASDATVYYSDCDASPGASGSIQLTKSADGQLFAKGMIVASGSENVRENYDSTKKQFTLSIGLPSSLLDTIGRAAQQSDVDRKNPQRSMIFDLLKR